MGRKAQATENKILQAARMLFWQKGYTAVGVDEICAAADVNKGSLYHYYQDKEHLALTVIETNSEMVFENIRENLQPLKPAARIFGYLDWMIAGQITEGRASGQMAGCPFGKLAAETAGQNTAIRDSVEIVFQKLLKFIASALKELTPDASDKKIKGKAQQMFMNWQGALVLSQARNSTQPLKQCRQLTAELLADL